MIISCFVPVLMAASFGLFASQIARRAHPSLAIWMLSAGSLLLTLGGIAALSVVIAMGLGQLAPFAWLGDWSTRSISLDSPFQEWSVWVAAFTVVAAAARVIHASRTRGRRLVTAWAVSRSVPDELMVLPDDEPFAYAIPGWPGRVVVSRGLLRDLDAPGRKAVLTHEQTHLAERHDLHQIAAVLAAAMNPLLHGVPAALRLACERQADEKAARAVGDRQAVARAITIAVRPHGVALAWQATGADVPLRVEALMSPPPGHGLVSSALLVSVVLVLAGSVASVVWLGHDLRNIFMAARL